MKGVRALENKKLGSPFGNWYRDEFGKDRGLTDVDAMECVAMMGNTWRMIEQRTPGYVPGNPDHALRIQREFCQRMELPHVVLDRFPMQAEISRDHLWLAEHHGRFAMFSVYYEVEAESLWPIGGWCVLSRLCRTHNVSYRKIDVSQLGVPLKPADYEWLSCFWR